MGPPTSSITVVVPVRRNERTIAPLAARLVAHLDERGGPYGIVFIDDQSDDRSWERIVAASAHPRIGGLRLEQRVGQMAAIMEGVRCTTSDHVVCIDADIECPPEEIGRMAAHLDDGADLVSTIRLGKSQRPVHRQLAYYGVRATVNRPVRRALVDISSGLKGWRRSVSEPLLVDWDRTYLSFIERMVGNAGRVDNIEVQWHPSEGRSGYRLAVVTGILRDIIVLRTARTRPAAVAAGGVVAATAAGLVATRHRDTRHRASTAAAWAATGMTGALLAHRSAERRAAQTQARAIAQVPSVVERVGLLSER